MPSPDRARITVPTGFSMLQFVFQQGESTADHHAGLIAASTTQALAAAFAQVERSCEGPPSGDFACLAITGGVSINAMVGVSANGRMHYFPLGTSLGRLLRETENVPPGLVPPDLKVHRRFRNRLAAIRYDQAAVLGLVLTDGDRIEWSSMGR